MFPKWTLVLVLFPEFCSLSFVPWVLFPEFCSLSFVPWVLFRASELTQLCLCVAGYLFENDSRVVPEKFEGEWQEHEPCSCTWSSYRLTQKSLLSWSGSSEGAEPEGVSRNSAELLVFPHLCATYLVTSKPRSEHQPVTSDLCIAFPRRCFISGRLLASEFLVLF